MKKIAFTIVAKNYIKFASVLCESMAKSNPDTDFVIYIADGVNDDLLVLAHDQKIRIVDVFDLEYKDLFYKMAFYYEVTEYCTSIKPFIFKHLLLDGYDRITYIDPDIFVYRSLDESVYQYLDDFNIFLTPHICSPITDDKTPSESDHLISGSYNLGFISINNSVQSSLFIDWWMLKCENECFNDKVKGLFVDQKWINLAPSLFDGVYISKHLGLNVAYWNLHERIVDANKLVVNEKYPLVFFHFSGINVNDIDSISKYQNRFTLESRTDLYPLFKEYKDRVNNFPDSSISKLPYRFNTYLSGKSISMLARKVYFWNRTLLNSPFLSSSDELVFRSKLSHYGIKDDTVSLNKKITNSEINSKAKIINLFLRILLRIIGAEKYCLLMKYFCFLSSLDNHKFIERNIDVK